MCSTLPHKNQIKTIYKYYYIPSDCKIKKKQDVEWCTFDANFV